MSLRYSIPLNQPNAGSEPSKRMERTIRWFALPLRAQRTQRVSKAVHRTANGISNGLSAEVGKRARRAGWESPAGEHLNAASAFSAVSAVCSLVYSVFYEGNCQVRR